MTIITTRPRNTTPPLFPTADRPDSAQADCADSESFLFKALERRCCRVGAARFGPTMFGASARFEWLLIPYVVYRWPWTNSPGKPGPASLTLIFPTLNHSIADFLDLFLVLPITQYYRYFEVQGVFGPRRPSEIGSAIQPFFSPKNAGAVSHTDCFTFSGGRHTPWPEMP